MEESFGAVLHLQLGGGQDWVIVAVLFRPKHPTKWQRWEQKSKTVCKSKQI